MPTPFLQTLSASARAAYPFIQRGVREGLSSRALERVIRAAGLQIRRQDLLTAMRLEGNIQTQGAALQFLGLDTRPNPSRLPTAVTKIRRRYSFMVQVQGIDLNTGSTRTTNVTITSDTLLTRREMERMAIETVESSTTRYGMDQPEAKLMSGIQSGPFGTF